MRDDDYLWDKSGAPDPEVERLERLLRPLGHRGQAPELPSLPTPEPLALRTHAPRTHAPRSRLYRAIPALAMAAGVIAVCATALWMHSPRSLPWDKGARFQVERIVGAPRVGSAEVSHKAPLAVGEWLETGPGGRARVDIGVVGQLEVEPNTRLQLVRTRQHEHRLSLAEGTIHAQIWAPPGSFFIDTPSATAIDLGCAYTLEVDREGAGLVRVTSGWVGFESRGRESFIPAGALCATRPGQGPGTPWREEAPDSLRWALERIDFMRLNKREHDWSLERVLALADSADAFTLWHLLSRERGDARALVYERMAVLAPPPAGVTREGVMRADRAMLDRWWDSLGLGDVKLWRTYESKWSGG